MNGVLNLRRLEEEEVEEEVMAEVVEEEVVVGMGMEERAGTWMEVEAMEVMEELQGVSCRGKAAVVEEVVVAVRCRTEGVMGVGGAGMEEGERARASRDLFGTGLGY